MTEPSEEDDEAQKEFEKYCREEADIKAALLGLLFFFAVLATSVAIGECLHARLP